MESVPRRRANEVGRKDALFRRFEWHNSNALRDFNTRIISQSNINSLFISIQILSMRHPFGSMIAVDGWCKKAYLKLSLTKVTHILKRCIHFLMPVERRAIRRQNWIMELQDPPMLISLLHHWSRHRSRKPRHFPSMHVRIPLSISSVH